MKMFPYRIRLRVLMFIVSAFYQVSESRKPILLPNSGQIIINEGETLNITCISDRPIVFISLNKLQGLSVSNYIKAREGFQQYNYYKENTIFNETGWYRCIDYFPTNDSFFHKYYNSYNSEESWVYVYVKSNKNFFVDENTNTYLNAIAGGNVVIPCRTTSPDLKPILINGNKDEVNKTSFDPRIGFTIRNLVLEDSNSYKCLMETDNKVHAVNYELSVHLNRKLAAPELQIGNIIEHNLYVNCTIKIEVGMQYEFDWNTPKQNSSRRQIKVFEKEIDGNTLLVTSQLMVFNYKNEDIGDYECVVKSGQDIHKKKISSAISGLIDQKVTIEFFSEDGTFYKKKKSGENVILKVKVYRLASTLPMFKGILQWFNPNGEKIVESPKYYVKHIKKNFIVTSSLQITRLNIMDSGNYTLHAQSTFSTERKNFLLDIIGKPISSLTRTETYYPPNESTEFHCEIISNPPPNITWSFLRYPKYPSFENTTTVYLTNVTQRAAYNSSYKIESMVTMPIEVSGKIKCEACNILGCNSKNEIILVSDGLGAFGIIGPRESVVKGDNIDLICTATVYNYMNNFMWTVCVNQTEKPVNETERLRVVQHRTPFTFRSMLKLNNVQKSDAQDYFCTGEIMSTSNKETLDSLSNRATYTLIIYDPILPFFNKTNLNRTKIRYIDVITEGHITVILQCFVHGMPKPTVTWYKDSVLLKKSDQYLFKYNYQELHIKYMMPYDSGKYSCRAISRLGTNETYQQITVKDTKWYTLDIILVTSVPILGFILVILAIFFTIKFHHEKKLREELLVPDLICFDGEYLTPSPKTENNEQFLPYNNKWEFPRDRLKLKEQLDSGYFGVIMKADALEIYTNETVTTVAVKMVRQSDDTTHLRALVSELKIMLHLGKHLNVVNLLGACTKNILKGELLVILEYCSFGNLHKHLLRHRNDFIDQIDSKTGKLDLTINIVKTTVNVSNDNSAKSDIDVVRYCPETNRDTSEVNTLSNFVSSSNSCQSNFCSNCKILHQNLKSICTQDLFSWAFQVARGMEYLSQRKVLHGDLAARNILLAEDNVVKICDFGLAKNMYKDYYKKESNAPVPVKWMAIESIRDNVFSTQSDVWSFGIMLWEFFTLAKEPYPGTETEKLYQKLIEGYRMEQPDYANREIYDIMLQCWEAKPASRPSFTNLVESIGNLLEESVKMHYIKLNIPYMDMKKKNLSTSKNNSLIMTTESDHAELSLSDYENSQFPKDRSNSLHVHVNPVSSTDSENTTELSPMLKHEEDAYLNPVNIHERRAKFIH